MDFETLLKTKAFLEEISVSIRNILLAQFPGMTREEREDIDHEVKLKLWKKIADGKKIDNLRSYLWRVVYTTALDVLDDRRGRVPMETVSETAREEGVLLPGLVSPGTAFEKKEFRHLIEEVIKTLPERRRTVLELYFSGMDLRQIAVSLRSRENQVRHLLYRGLADLRERIKKWKK